MKDKTDFAVDNSNTAASLPLPTTDADTMGVVEDGESESLESLLLSGILLES